ncbi:MAG: hypothetical protein ACMVO5_12380 [Polymorphobacter sp.]|uniref:hypothetical protein n=1 Tax=Polymorphobacter sp. TaxID=1909290 RepID=UPI003A8427CB
MGERPAHLKAQQRLRLLAAAALVWAGPLAAQPAPSLLPDAFRNAPEPEPEPDVAPLPGVTPPSLPGVEGPGVEGLPLPGVDGPPGEGAGDGLVDAPVVAPVRDPLAALPRSARRIGLYPSGLRGWRETAYAASDGRFVAALMRRIEAPLASRWATIGLRNALLTRASAPAGLSPGDWVAARAGLLVRLGEIDGARALIDALPLEANTPAATRVAANAAMAAADLGALCPVARTGRQISADPLWELVLGMCAALEGDDISAAAVFDSLRNRASSVSPFDLRLAEGVAVVAGTGGSATNIAWGEAPPLTLFRFGVATAAGVQIPEAALGALGPARHGWIVRQPGIAAERRLASLGPAAVIGTVSAAEYVAGVSALAADDGPDSAAARLRAAFAAGSAASRLEAMRAIWGRSIPGLSQASARYAGYILTARAAARLEPADALAEDAADVIASLLSAGNVRAARRWWPVASTASGPVRARAWALLATSGALTATPEALADWREQTGADDASAGRLLAALTGLGMAEAEDYPDGLVAETETRWSRALAEAAAAGRRGEVMVLVATGLQGAWRAVPPHHLRAITAALVRIGKPGLARAIAAEAVTRG